MKESRSVATKKSLIEAGIEIFEERGLSAMRIDDIVQKAGVAKGTFYVHFPDRASFLTGIHKEFHDALEESILKEIGDLPRGKKRLLKGMEVYLDSCLIGRAVKAMLFDARSEESLRNEVQKRNEKFSGIVTEDFRALKYKDASSAALLFIAMCAEAALQEMQVGKKIPPLRRVIAGFI